LTPPITLTPAAIPMFRHRAALLVVTLVCAFSWWTGARGIDFGHHWDEQRLIQSVARSAASGVWLPGWYNYPSLSYDLTLTGLLPALPSVVRPAARPTSDSESVSKLLDSVTAPVFHLRVRLIFLTATLLTGFAVYWLTTASTNRPALGVLAAALLLLSWEVGYHARWIAPDGPMMTSMTFAALGAVMTLKSPHGYRWLIFTAVMAALTMNAKYNGGLVLLLVIFLIAHRVTSTVSPGRPLRHQVTRFLRLSFPVLLVVVSTSLVLTPGALLEPFSFVADLHYEMEHYSWMGHGGYTTGGFIDHLVLVLQYLALHGLSAHKWVAAALAGFALAGTAVLARKGDLSALFVVIVPVAYVLLMSAQRVFIVRNMLCIIPFIAFLASIGFGAMHDALTRRWRRLYLIPAMAALVLVVNGGWLYRASETVVARHQRAPAQEMHAYLTASPAQDRFLFSRTAALRAAIPAGDSTPITRHPGAGAATRSTWLVFLSTDVDRGDWWRWPANRFDYKLLPSGPYEVNWTYYPSWAGDERFVMLPLHDVMNSPLRILLNEITYEIRGGRPPS
jgi:Dolichyl-phosphate-mannose-protein mannosyltransferase